MWRASGSPPEPQNWNPVARQAAVARGLSLAENARAFALLNLAGADAFIAAWDAKFAYNQWRPVTAIRAAASDGNRRQRRRVVDAAACDAPVPRLHRRPHDLWRRRGESPRARVRKQSRCRHDAHEPDRPWCGQTFTTFKAMAENVVDARVWGGIHWRTSCERGRTVGEEIGRYVAHRFLKRVR